MDIRHYLRDRQVWFETLLHAPAPSASKRARSVHVSGRCVAKGVLVKSGETFALAVLPAVARVDLARLGDVLGSRAIRLATEDEAASIFGDCERGALPPFGRLYGLPTIVDASLADATGEIVFVGNARHEGVRMRYRDYEALETPRIADFTAPLPPSRRAG